MLNNPVVDAIKCDGSSACTKIRTFFAERYKDKTIKEFGHIVKNRALS